MCSFSKQAFICLVFLHSWSSSVPKERLDCMYNHTQQHNHDAHLNMYVAWREEISVSVALPSFVAFLSRASIKGAAGPLLSHHAQQERHDRHSQKHGVLCVDLLLSMVCFRWSVLFSLRVWCFCMCREQRNTMCTSNRSVHTGSNGIVCVQSHQTEQTSTARYTRRWMWIYSIRWSEMELSSRRIWCRWCLSLSIDCRGEFSVAHAWNGDLRAQQSAFFRRISPCFPRPVHDLTI